jgi:hypothetical protein
MKKLLVFSISILLVTLLNAQVKLGLKAGINIAKQKYSSGGMSITPDAKVGFAGGVILDAGISENFFFQPGLIFSQKGMKMSLSSYGVSGSATLTLNYLDVTLNLLYKIKTGDIKILLSAGPLISFGLSGKGSANGEDSDIKFGSANDDDFKAMDFGLGIGGGIEFDQFQLGVNYTFGLSNIGPSSQSTGTEVTVKNNVLSLTLAVLF